MATVIDALIMTLGLDSSGFKKGSQDAVETSKKTTAELDKQAKEIEAAQKKALDAFGKVADAALRFFGILTAGRGVIDFTEDSINMAASLERLAENTGTSASTISQWSRAVEVAGGTQEGFQHTLMGMSQMFTDLRTKGTSDLVPFFQAFHVALSDSQGRARPVVDLLMDLSKAAQSMPRQDAFNLFTTVGHMDAGTANLLLKGPDAVRAMIEAQRRQAAVTDEQAKRAEALRQQWVQVGQTLDSIAQRMVAAVTPALMKLWDGLQRIASWFSDHEEVAQALFLGLAAAVAAAAVPLALFLAPLIAVGAQLALIVAGVAAVKLAFDRWMASGAASAKMWVQVWSAALGAVTAVWKLIVAVFTGNSVDITNAWRGAANAFKSLFGDAFSYVKTLWKDLIGGIEGFFSGNGLVAKWLRGRIAALMNTDGATAPSAPSTSTAPVTQTASSSGGMTDMFEVRSIRNNNPGNLNFAHQSGATLESGTNARFAKFDTMEQGVAQLARQLMLYRSRGLTTLSSIMGKFAPMSENNTQQYVANLTGRMHVGANDQIDVSNPEIMRQLIMGISRYEAGKSYLSDDTVKRGMASAGVRSGNVTNNLTITVGEIKVVSSAADPHAVAKQIPSAIVAQADTGMR